MVNGIEEKDIKNLVALARIKVTPEEEVRLLTDVQGILGYISEIQKIDIPDTFLEEDSLINVMREDDTAHEAGIYTDAILREAPKTENGYIVVKKIL
jgi:aspartyl-tRNA(Asn)/glutamyl-tRNA(Gln) amidotransferase subunit C